MNTQHVTLDIDKRYDPSQVVTIGQGDSSGTTIVAEVYDNGAAVTLTGMTARFCMRLPDGVHYVRDEDCTVSGSSITYVVDEEYCASVRGRTDEAYFDILSSGSVVYSTSRFTVHVLRGVTDGAEAGESYDSAIEEAIREANEAVENANEAAEEAREAAGGTIPLMSANQRGGAKLGNGLAMSGESLGISPMSTTEIEAITEEILPPVTNDPLDAQGVGMLWTKIKQKFARLVSGAVAITQGGTGATTAAAARANLDAAQSNGATGTLKSAEGEIDALESSLAYVESTTARTNHAVGDYFMLGNVLMKATAAIAAGETINASKATPATVQGQIDTLRDSVARTLKFTRLTTSPVQIPSGQSVSLPDGYTSASMALICGYGYDGMRFTHLGAAGSINIPVAATASSIGKISFNVSTGLITNSTNVTVKITEIFAVTTNS